MSQQLEILRYLKKQPITPLEALEGIGCFRLAARIKELREQGYNIRTDMMESEGKTFARYTLLRGKNV